MGTFAALLQQLQGGTPSSTAAGGFLPESPAPGASFLPETGSGAGSFLSEGGDSTVGTLLGGINARLGSAYDWVQQQAKDIQAKLTQSIQNASQPGTVATGPTGAPVSNTSQQAFFQRMAPLATQAATAAGLPPDLLLGIAANETGNGQAVAGNNYFGIKATGSEPNTGLQNTWEVLSGRPVNTQATFRSYANPQASFQDFGGFLASNSRYAPALARYQQTGNRAQLVQDIHAAGYATDPDWATKINRLADAAQAALQPPAAGATAQHILADAQSWLNVPYVWGGSTKSGADCSGFVSAVFQETGQPFPGGRLDAEGLRKATQPVDPAQAQPGDLIFFQNTDPNLRSGVASHVGILTQTGVMLDAHGNGVAYTTFGQNPYWEPRILGVGRPPQYTAQ